MTDPIPVISPSAGVFVQQVLARSTTLLSGERKPSVLVEGTRITQSSDVLPSGPLTPAMALGNGMRAGVVGEQRSGGSQARSGPLGVPPDHSAGMAVAVTEHCGGCRSVDSR
ncbi:MAG: hypothetical protein V9F03_07850 [Microthrixaceae bacterium]